MPRFDVYRNRARNREASPFVLDIQGNTVDFVETRIVIPLTRLSRLLQARNTATLFPAFYILGDMFFLQTTALGPVMTRTLIDPVTSLQQAQHRITSALDFLFNGY